MRLHAAVEQQNGAVRELLHQSQIVRDEQDRNLALAQLLELAHAAIGEDRVADRQGLVDDQDFGVHMNRGGERQPDVHAARILFDRARDEFADLRECFDRWHGAISPLR